MTKMMLQNSGPNCKEQDHYATHKLKISSNILDFEEGLLQKGERMSKEKSLICADNHTLLNKILTSLHYFGSKGKSLLKMLS